jgi:hypothetical protein
MVCVLARADRFGWIVHYDVALVVTDKNEMPDPDAV